MLLVPRLFSRVCGFRTQTVTEVWFGEKNQFQNLLYLYEKLVIKRKQNQASSEKLRNSLWTKMTSTHAEGKYQANEICC